MAFDMNFTDAGIHDCFLSAISLSDTDWHHRRSDMASISMPSYFADRQDDRKRLARRQADTYWLIAYSKKDKMPHLRNARGAVPYTCH